MPLQAEMLKAVVDLADHHRAEEVRLFGAAGRGMEDQWSDLDVARRLC